MSVFSLFVKLTFVAILFELFRWHFTTNTAENSRSSSFAAPGWSSLTEVFDKLLLEESNHAGSFAVYHKGELVFHAYGGYADEDLLIPHRNDTILQIFSTTKAIGAIVIAKLVEQGHLDYKSPVSKYWPEFSQHGKGGILVEQLLSHQAGLTQLDSPVSYHDMLDNPEKVARSLAEQKPLWQLGTGFGYHTLTIGLYEDQLVRRADPKHRTLAQYFHEEFAKPLGLDIHIGLPLSENYRTAMVYERGFIDLLKTYQFWYVTYDLIMNPGGLFAKSISTPGMFQEGYTVNSPWTRKVPQPSANGFATALDLGKLFGILANGGNYKGQVALKEKQIEALIEPLVSGTDKVLAVSCNYSRGVLLSPTPHGGVAFGTPGKGGQMAFADRKKRLGWAFVTNYHGSHLVYDPRYTALTDEMYAIVDRLEQI